MENYDLVVIGAGPIGLKSAEIVARNGYNVLVIEKRKEIGYPNHCSGLVSPRFISENKVPNQLVVSEIKGAELHCQDEHLLFKGSKSYAFVINRAEFDKNLAKQAEKNGARILMNTSVRKWKRERNDILLTLSNGKDVRTHLVIIASGALTGISRMFRFKEVPKEVIHTLQFDAPVLLKDTEIVYTFFKNEISHNWFSWIIPLENGKAHIGLGTDKRGNIVSLMKKFLEENPYLKEVKLDLKNAVSWMIPIGLFKEISKDNIMIVGDAAAQVKPFSGGGLHTGITSAVIAANTSLKALKIQDYSQKTLSEYGKGINQKIAPIISQGLILRRIYKSMGDKDKELFLKGVNNEEAKNIILKNGSIDDPLSVGQKLFKFIRRPLLIYFKDFLAETLSISSFS